jgi:ABC-2 type transport system ATP-binding protein
MPAIEVRNLRKVYRTVRRQPGLAGALRTLFRPSHLEVEAVKDVSFSLEEGELVGFLGPNGAGKTTTLKMLAGLLFPTAGEARVLGFIPWERRDAFRRSIALVLGQKNQLWWDLPALDSLALNREIYQIPMDRWARIVDDLTQRLGVAHRLQVQVRELSLGERMKFELIASLLHEPRVLFLDEPTIGLDLISQKAVREFLKSYNATGKTTVLLTSHNMADIKGLASRVIVINHGAIVFDGPLASLIERWGAAKHVRIVAARDLTRADLDGFGEVARLEGPIADLRLPRDRVAAATAAMLSRLPVVDLTVEDPPIEDVIAEAFRVGTG